MSDHATVDDVLLIRRKWNRPQTIFRRVRGTPGGALIYKDLEGAVGSGKTTAPAWMLVEYATEYAGIFMALCAWTDEMLGPPKTAFLEAARQQGFSVDAGNLTWHGGQGEEYYEFEGYGSRVYVRSMRASEADMRYMKLAGLSLSVIWIDQPEPVPVDVYDAYIPARLRQPGFPHEVWLSPNPLDEDHWLSQRFPTDPAHARPNHHYIHVALHDNVENVGGQFIRDMEAAHPPDSPTHNLQVAGCRGPSLRGKPVYAGYFDRAIHLDPTVAYEPAYPLLEGWDFGEEKPAVSWWQYHAHIGALRLLGAVKGEHLFLEDFAPKVIEIRSRWFPAVPPQVLPGTRAKVLSWCDPNGNTGTHGTEYTAVRLLHSLGVPATFDGNANQLPVRNGAIQVLAGFMRRLGRDKRPAFLMHPRCIELKRQHGVIVETDSMLMVQAFQVGYIWSELAAPDTNPNIRKPQKGTRYDDLMNSGEYVVIGQKLTVPMEAEMIRAENRLQLLARNWDVSAALADRRPTGETMAEAIARLAAESRAYKDRDPADARRRGDVVRLRRGGW